MLKKINELLDVYLDNIDIAYVPWKNEAEHGGRTFLVHPEGLRYTGAETAFCQGLVADWKAEGGKEGEDAAEPVFRHRFPEY